MTTRTSRIWMARNTVGLFLIAACSAAESSGDSDDAGMTNGEVTTPLPPAPPGGGSQTPPGSGTNTAPTPGVENDPAPVGLDPGGTNVPPVTAPVTGEDGPSVDPVVPDPSGSSGLIRGADPSVESATREGPFDVETLSAGLRDGPGYGTQTLHVPVDAEPPFASVVVVPGFVSPESSIRAWGPFLASHGIVALTIGTNSGGDSPDVRARALLDGIETLKAENDRAGSPVAGAMALDRFGVMGWSMGGGGTLIAANGHPELRAAVTLAAWSPGVQFADNAVPTLLLAGSADTLAGGQSQGFFDSIPEATPKMLFEVAGGPHSIANDPNAADGEVGRYGLSWLKVFLEGDERYRQFLLVTPESQSEFRENL
jgi:dienelactone hydrolase